MQIKMVIVCGLAALVFSLVLPQDASAQYRDRNREPQAAPENTEREINREKPSRGVRPGDRKEQQNKRAPRSKAQPKAQPRRAAPKDNQRQQAQPRDQRRRRAEPNPDRGRRAKPQRRTYDRRAERRWHRNKPAAQRRIYIPRRWKHNDKPRHRNLWQRRYSRVWWCGVECRIARLFGFTIWAVNTVVSYDSGYSFPIWESLEYNATGETSLWESNWGYVEFTPIRTFRRRFGRRMRDCRDFLRVVVRNDGLERRYKGTACRNPRGVWWIASSHQVFS